jgi:hypothetical protein
MKVIVSVSPYTGRMSKKYHKDSDCSCLNGTVNGKPLVSTTMSEQDAKEDGIRPCMACSYDPKPWSEKHGQN